MAAVIRLMPYQETNQICRMKRVLYRNDVPGRNYIVVQIRLDTGVWELHSTTQKRSACLQKRGTKYTH